MTKKLTAQLCGHLPIGAARGAARGRLRPFGGGARGRRRARPGPDGRADLRVGQVLDEF